MPGGRRELLLLVLLLWRWTSQHAPMILCVGGGVRLLGHVTSTTARDIHRPVTGLVLTT